MANGNVACADYGTWLARRTEHIQDEILADITPIGNLNGMSEVGTFKPFYGTTQTFEKFNRVAVDQSAAWADVHDGHCIGAPCDPNETKLCFGSDDIDYTLQQKSFATDLICYDQLLTIDKAKEHYANAVQQLKDAQQLIISNRLRTEMFRIAGYKWLAGGGNASGLTPFTYSVITGNHIVIRIVGGGGAPTSKMVVNMLRRRLQTQILEGALGRTPAGQPAVLEVMTDMDTIWDLIQGDSNLADRWQFTDFNSGAEEYYKYGWSGRVGNFNLKADIHPMRFQVLANGDLNQVFPYTNGAGTWGLKGSVNPAYIDAPIQALFIWHRRAMRQEVLDAKQIHPMMPFVPRSFGGEWQFVMDNLTCGTTTVHNTDGTDVILPIAVDNSRRNKGKFIADFKFATKPQFPLFAEVFLHLRENACIVEVPPCDDGPAYVTQDYGAACDPCVDIVAETPQDA